MRRSNHSRPAGMCGGRPTSWSSSGVGGVWRVPHLITTTPDTSLVTTTTKDTHHLLLADNSDSLIETCEEEAVTPTETNATLPNDVVGTMTNGTTLNNTTNGRAPKEEEEDDDITPTKTDPTANRCNSLSDSDTHTNTSNTTSSNNSRLKAKISLDENKLRMNLSSYDNENFTRSDTITRTLGLDKWSGRRGGGLKTALARSSSYQALHSALARLYRLDDFITERLGQGFFSEVFKVCHRVTGDVMVLKMNKLVSNRHNMLKEVELMNRLNHQNILTYYGVCINEGQVHALTEYINGGSLDAMLQDRSVEISWSERVALAADTARGMTYLHKQGVFHRDLTSKNVLIKETGGDCSGRRRREAVVADFGLAAPIPKDKSVRMRQVGSPYWMAPEVIRGVWYDHRADVFSFGIILCEMIARCEADPDVLPRTNNFGVHYLAFSRMCQNDCPPYFLQMAFQCCQIDPDTRPNFDALTKNFESLLNRLVGHRGSSVHRKQKVCHRRSLSDDCLLLGRSSSSEDSCGSGGSQGSPAQTGLTSGAAPVGRTPQEVVERMGEADPYFNPSTATVNPFTRVKLPAPSRLTVQDGARFCHSLPDPLPAHKLRPQPRPRHPSAHHGSHNSLATGGVHEVSGQRLAVRQDHAPHLGGAIKRRGSGESGFFSVGDMDRTGTPELWLSYSELSCASLADEERSWVTDSSDDLCVGGQEEPDTQETDIKAIVEFFEQGYGSLRPGPLLGPRSSRLSPRSPASPPHSHVWSIRQPAKTGLRPLNSRRDTFRVKDRPKLYITEGTVRAKRDIFEAK